MYDNAEYLNISYPSNLTQEEQLDFLTDTAKVSALLTFTHHGDECGHICSYLLGSDQAKHIILDLRNS